MLFRVSCFTWYTLFALFYRLKVEYSSDSNNKYDFLEMGKTGMSSIQVYGRLQFSCQDFGMDDPVCLSTPRSFLVSKNVFIDFKTHLYSCKYVLP